MLPLSRPAVSCGAFSPEYISPVGAGAILQRSRRMGSIKRPLNQEAPMTGGFARSNLTASVRWFLAKL